MNEPGINWNLTEGIGALVLWAIVGAVAALLLWAIAAVVVVWGDL